MMAKHKTDANHEATHDQDTGRARNRGANEGIGTENNPHGAVPHKSHPEDHVRSEPPQKPVSSGPTVADVDAPVLEGHEGQEGGAYETVRLTDGPIGPNDGTPYRVATPLPLVLVSAGRRYVRSTKDTYVLQVP
jgi:hypothetical protein